MKPEPTIPDVLAAIEAMEARLTDRMISLETRVDRLETGLKVEMSTVKRELSNEIASAFGQSIEPERGTS